MVSVVTSLCLSLVGCGGLGDDDSSQGQDGSGIYFSVTGSAPVAVNVVSHSPVSNGTNVRTNAVIHVEVDAALNGSAVTDMPIQLIHFDTLAVIPTAMGYDAGSNTVMLTPLTSLEPDSNYQVEISEAEFGEERFSMDSLSWTFSTEAQIVRVSSHNDGTEGNGNADKGFVNDDGSVIAFSSRAKNIVDGDSNKKEDAFIALNLMTERVLTWDDKQANNHIDTPVVSGNGDHLAFYSGANNLVDGDNNGQMDVFHFDAQSKSITIVSKHSNGTLGNKVSQFPSISANGQYIVFTSAATNLVDGDTNGRKDIFRHNRITGETERVSVASDGAQGNGHSNTNAGNHGLISADGRYVVFTSKAKNLVDNDLNKKRDVFLKDMVTGAVTLVSKHSNGTQANNHSNHPAISHDGRYVVYSSTATNLVDGDTNKKKDIFLFNTNDQSTVRVSVDTTNGNANGNSDRPSINVDGQFIVFESSASDLIDDDFNGKRDVFVMNTATMTIARASESALGFGGNQTSHLAQMSGDGRYVIFSSTAGDLVLDDYNGKKDIFRVLNPFN